MITVVLAQMESLLVATNVNALLASRADDASTVSLLLSSFFFCVFNRSEFQAVRYRGRPGRLKPTLNFVKSQNLSSTVLLTLVG